ncbi:MAG TPA: hypothetical protein VFO20_03970, partial [Propionibacteriaceae bacterium]|nr:hypothetical protein [Propionibacteriaceae bacterium]
APDSDLLFDQQIESEKAEDSDELYDQLGESERADHQLHEQPGDSLQGADSGQLYDQLAEPAPESQTDTSQNGVENPRGDVSAPQHVDTVGGDRFASTDYPENELEAVGDGELSIEDDRAMEDHRPYDQKNERRESNGEAWRRLGLSIRP